MQLLSASVVLLTRLHYNCLTMKFLSRPKSCHKEPRASLFLYFECLMQWLTYSMHSFNKYLSKVHCFKVQYSVSESIYLKQLVCTSKIVPLICFLKIILLGKCLLAFSYLSFFKLLNFTSALLYKMWYNLDFSLIQSFWKINLT